MNGQKEIVMSTAKRKTRRRMEESLQNQEAESRKWLVVAYEAPNEPSKFRVKVWRDLKSQGGLYPQMSFCILPYAPSAISKLKEIRSGLDKVGKMLVLETNGFSMSDSRLLEKMMRDQTERQYLEIYEECQEFLDEIKSNLKNKVFKDEEIQELDESLEGLNHWLEKTRSLDTQASSDARSKVREILDRCAKALDDYAAQVEMRKEKRQRSYR